MKLKFIALLFVISIMTKLTCSAQVNFPNLNNGFPVNNSVQSYTFNLIGFCSMTSSNDMHTLSTATNSGLNPIASGVVFQFKVTNIISSSTVSCIQTGTTISVGNTFTFTTTNPQFAFTSSAPSTVVGDFMAVGTPTVLNEPYECGYFVSATLGNCGNTSQFTGKNKFSSSNPLCNVGISNGINEKQKTEGLSFYPNPAKTSLTINNKSNSALSGQITNTLGQKIKSFIVENGNNTIDISDLTQGTYYISLSENNKLVSNEKLIIIK